MIDFRLAIRRPLCPSSHLPSHLIATTRCEAQTR